MPDKPNFISPKKLFLDINNEFQAPIQLYDSFGGNEYLLLLVLASRKMEYHPRHGMTELPRGARVLDQRAVVSSRVSRLRLYGCAIGDRFCYRVLPEAQTLRGLPSDRLFTEEACLLAVSG
jgi:hypothetical protein